MIKKYSLIALKNNNRYLLYYDTQWNCFFFPNYPTSDFDNESHLKIRLSNDLKIPTNNLHLSFIKREVQEKFKESINSNRVYKHSLYKAKLDNYSSITKDEFNLQGKLYRWFTIDEMKQNKEIYRKNHEVIDFINKNIQ